MESRSEGAMYVADGSPLFQNQGKMEVSGKLYKVSPKLLPTRGPCGDCCFEGYPTGILLSPVKDAKEAYGGKPSPTGSLLRGPGRPVETLRGHLMPKGSAACPNVAGTTGSIIRLFRYCLQKEEGGSSFIPQWGKIQVPQGGGQAGHRTPGNS